MQKKTLYQTVFLSSLFSLLFFALVPKTALALAPSPSFDAVLRSLGVEKRLLCPSGCGREPGTIVTPEKIIMHVTEGPAETALGEWKYFNSGSEGRNVGTHFIIGKAGDTIQAVEMGETQVEFAHTVGGYKPHISIEMTSRHAYTSKADMPAAQYKAAFDLVRALMKQYNIPIGNFQYNQNYPTDRGVYGHYQMAPGLKTDPGAGWLRDFRAELKAAGPISSDESTSTTSTSTNTVASGLPGIQSNCEVTDIGNPTPRPLPPECANAGTVNTGTGTGTGTTTGGTTGTSLAVDPGVGTGPDGQWRFPLTNVNEVTGVFTEMAAYADYWAYLGHKEHAGLDLGTANWGYGPVYAVTGGTVVERANAYCPEKEDGCSVSIRHNTDKFISRYTHIDIAASIYHGKVVSKGELLGYVHKWPCANPGYKYYPPNPGDHCNAANDHLHFELRYQEKLDSTGEPVNINPRNYFPQLARFGIVPGYYGNVRVYTANRGLPWQNDGKEFGEMYANHPPCPGVAGCWAH